MTRTKIVFSILLATIFLATQFIAVGAAPATQETTPITGTIESVVLETDTATDTTTVVVTLTDEFGETQTIRLSLEDATALGLVTDDSSGPVVDDSQIGTTVEIDPTLVIPDETTDEEQHPVGSALSDFFTDLLGVDYEMIMDYHEDGMGFGVIAQALWMTNSLVSEGDTEMEMTPEELFSAILDAKKNKDFGAITLPDGSEPTNWGQFRKAIMSDRDKSKENLGAIMSGRAENGQADEGQTELKNNGKGPDKSNNAEKSNNGKSEGKGNGKDKNKDKDKGKNK
ncbi:MAG: hypothetical protein WBL25_11650 [Anaerolineales bacterium]